MCPLFSCSGPCDCGEFLLSPQDFPDVAPIPYRPSMLSSDTIDAGWDAWGVAA